MVVRSTVSWAVLEYASPSQPVRRPTGCASVMTAKSLLAAVSVYDVCDWNWSNSRTCANQYLLTGDQQRYPLLCLHIIDMTHKHCHRMLRFQLQHRLRPSSPQQSTWPLIADTFLTSKHAKSILLRQCWRQMFRQVHD